ncbi:MAG: hypothetical protein IKW17_07325 [Paludibacteraceae bacterium]|nr:hypothetical protein [Paludibacteraceae bacterium]
MKKITFLISLTILILVGCEEKFKSQFWINPDIEYCGTNVPIDSLEWFKKDFLPRFNLYNDNYEDIWQYYSMYIYLYSNNTTQENFVVTTAYSGDYFIDIYSCDGTLIDMGYYNKGNEDWDHTPIKEFIKITPSNNSSAALKCTSCDKFFKTHTLIETIAYWKINPNLDAIKKQKKEL